jgi:hypothetical protein
MDRGRDRVGHRDAGTQRKEYREGESASALWVIVRG